MIKIHLDKLSEAETLEHNFSDYVSIWVRVLGSGI